MKLSLSVLTGVTDPDDPMSGNAGPFSLVDVVPVSCAGCDVSNLNSAAGTFDFDPPAGGTGAYTLKYRVADSGTPQATSAYANINITVNGPVIWFVNPAVATTGDGRLSGPFKTLAEADAVDGANQRIFIYCGSVATGVTLNSGEWLVGQGVSGASFDAVLGITPPATTIARPGINGTKPTVAGGVVAASSSKVLGLSVQPGSGVVGISGTNVNGVTIGDVSVTTVAASAVNFQGLTGSAAVSNSSLTAGGGDNFRIDNSSGTLDRITFDYRKLRR